MESFEESRGGLVTIISTIVLLISLTAVTLTVGVPALQGIWNPHGIISVRGINTTTIFGTVVSVNSWHGSAWFGLTSKTYTQLTVSVLNETVSANVSCDYYRAGSSIPVSQTVYTFKDNSTQTSYQVGTLPEGC